MGYSDKCFNMQALYQIPIGNNFYLDMGSRLSSDHYELQHVHFG